MQIYLINILFIVFAYLMGSIPFGLLIGKIAGLGDVRTQGSGNIGATNLLRTGGKKLGIITLILDALKGFIPVFVATYYASTWGVAFAAVAAVLGHVFPVWLKFKGGKGVATTLAVYAAFVPGVFVCAGLTWIGIFYLSRISSLSSLGMMIVAPVIALFFTEFPIFLAILGLSILVIYKHKDNILRLLRGQEQPFSSK